ncbi:MAG: metalloprotease [Euryarchaeota archaeon]|nr:metalloprotease [Euryarchaeota archaeon]
MSAERDPRAWRIDDDPFDKRERAGGHSAARDDGSWRQPNVRVVRIDHQGRPLVSVFGTPQVTQSIPIHRGSIWHFSKTEIQHLLLATVAFTAALALMFSGGIFGALSLGPVSFLLFCMLSLISLAPAFLLHEIAHKVVARQYGCWAEFRADPAGLRFGLLLAAVFGIVFMAPGAVMVAGNTTRTQFGRIALAGPVTNIVLWCLGYVAFYLVGGHVGLFDIVIETWMWGNAILAAFNMLPFGPLDGRKIKTWSEPIYYPCLSIAIGVVYLTYTGSTLFG